METNKLIAGIVAAAIAIIVLAGVLMPALGNATTTTDTFTNEGYFYMSELKSDYADDVTLVWDHTKPNIITVNDVDVELPSTVSIGAVSIIMSDTWGLRYTPNSSIDLFGDAGGIITTANVASGTDMTITLSGGTASFSTSELTQSYDIVYHVSESGDYVMKKSTDTVYLNGDSLIYCTGRTNVSGGQKNINITGNIDDGITATIIYPHGWTTGNPTTTYTEVSDHIDLYSFTSFSFSLTDGNTTGNATYSQVMIPYEVTAERSVHLSDAMNVILNVIPLLIIVAVLLGVVAVFILRRE